jgi:uncharacterized protein YdeI (BOF family)
MKKLAVALVALILAAPAHVAAQDVAPPVKRKPVATGQAASQQARRPASAQDYQAALAAAAAQDGSEAALDGSLVRVMSRLLAAGRCGDAVSLATRDGREGLATRAQQLCK